MSERNDRGDLDDHTSNMNTSNSNTSNNNKHLNVPSPPPPSSHLAVTMDEQTSTPGIIKVEDEEQPDKKRLLEGEGDAKEGNLFIDFLLSRSTTVWCIKMMLLAVLVTGIGMLSEPFTVPTAPVTVVNTPAVPGAQKPVKLSPKKSWPIRESLVLLGVSIGGASFTLLLFHMILSIFNSFDSSTLIYYLSEVEWYIAFSVWATIEASLLYFAPKNRVVNMIVGQASAEIIRDDGSVGIATELVNYVLKALISLIVMFSILAYKRHVMRNLGMSFNYANFMDRIKECLWAERVLQSLMKSRAAYKFRSRWKAFVPMFGTGTHQPRRSELDTHQLTVTSMQTSPDHSMSNDPVPPTASTPKDTKKPKDKEAEKKKDFDAFLLLANRTLVHLDSSNVADYRVETAKEAIRLAAKLYHWLRPANRDYLVANDFGAYVEDPEDVQKLVEMLNRRSGDIVAISEADLRRVIDGILQDRYGLAKSMRSIETALDRIDTIFTISIIVAAIILFALLFSGLGETLTSISTFVTALSFVFQSSAGQLFESIVFLLVIHPFDVGDRVYVKLDTGVIPPFGEAGLDNLVVSAMHVLSTEFERWDGVRVYVPNYILANRPIFNIRRSGPINDFLRIQVDYTTPLDRIYELRRRLEAFCKKESADFTGYCRLNVEYMENCNRLGLFVVVQHRTNWQDYELQLSRRTKVLTFVKSVLDELSIGYLPPLQRVAMICTNGMSSPSLQ